MFRVLGIAIAGGRFHTGHAVRLANLFVQAPAGFTTELLVATELDRLPLPPCARKPTFIPLDSPAAVAKECEKIIGQVSPHILLFDCLDEFSQLKLESAKLRPTVVLDDASNNPANVHLTINSVLGDWDGGVSISNGQFLAQGPQYFVMPPGIEAARRKRDFTSGINLLIALGGTDSTRSTLTVMRTLPGIAALPESGPVNVVSKASVLVLAGQDHPDYSEIKDLAKTLGSSVGWGVDIVSVLRWADAAITGGGMTSFECASAGVPLLIIPARNHERRTANLLTARGCALLADPDFENGIAKVLGEFISKPERLREIAVTGPTVVDGAGAQRVWALIGKLMV